MNNNSNNINFTYNILEQLDINLYEEYNSTSKEELTERGSSVLVSRLSDIISENAIGSKKTVKVLQILFIIGMIGNLGLLVALFAMKTTQVVQNL